MKIATNFTPTNAWSTTPGELVSLQYGSRSALGINLFSASNGAPVFIFLDVNGVQDRNPFYSAVDTDDGCLSLGGDWTIRIDKDDQSYSGNSKYHDVPGVIHLSDKSFIMNIARDQSDRDKRDIRFNISKWGIAGSLMSNMTPFLSWSIWPESEDPYTSKRAPIFQYRHETT